MEAPVSWKGLGFSQDSNSQSLNPVRFSIHYMILDKQLRLPICQIEAAPPTWEGSQEG